MNGILNVLKPPSMTSFDIVAYLRRVLSEKKVGHAGTLDPSAAGVLPVCVGKATKAIEFMMDKHKKYRAELRLGIQTDTQDSDGKILDVREVNVDAKKIEKVFKSFKGEYSQVPPMYSAKKINGKKLYELAREGRSIDRKANNVNIFSIHIIDMDLTKEYPTVLFDVECSKGTYIRTLCNDIGRRLDCGGHMSFLLRTQAGDFKLEDTITLEEIKAAGTQDIEDLILPVESIFNDYDSIILNERNQFKLLNGGWIQMDDLVFKAGTLYRLYGRNKEFLALGEVFKDKKASWLKIKKAFI